MKIKWAIDLKPYRKDKEKEEVTRTEEEIEKAKSEVEYDVDFSKNLSRPRNTPMEDETTIILDTDPTHGGQITRMMSLVTSKIEEIKKIEQESKELKQSIKPQLEELKEETTTIEKSIGTNVRKVVQKLLKNIPILTTLLDAHPKVMIQCKNSLIYLLNTVEDTKKRGISDTQILEIFNNNVDSFGNTELIESIKNDLAEAIKDTSETVHKVKQEIYIARVPKTKKPKNPGKKAGISDIFSWLFDKFNDIKMLLENAIKYWTNDIFVADKITEELQSLHPMTENRANILSMTRYLKNL